MTTSANNSSSIPLSPSPSSTSASSNASTSGAVGVPKLEVVNTRNPQVIRIALIGIVLLVVVALVGVLSGLSGKKKTSVNDNSMDSVLNSPGQSNLAGATADASTGSNIGTPAFPSVSPSTGSLPSSGLSIGPTGPSATTPDRGLLDPGHALTPLTDASRPPSSATPSSRPPSSGTPGNAPTPNDSPSSKTYVVQAGDTLWAIAQKVYGDGSKYKQLVKDNPGIAIGKLQAGTKLKVSPATSSSATASSSSSSSGKPTAITKGKTVITKEGQTLRSIAKREYGNPGLWELIYKANKSKIKNPSELPVGVTLIIPPKP